MTISSTTSEVSYAGNGVTLAFDIPFVFDTSADLLIYEQVVSTGVVTQRTTGIVVSGGDGSTGTLTYSVAPPTGTNITILDNPERTQTHDYVENDPFPAESHEGALDKLTRLAKRLYQTSLKSLRVADGDAYTSMVLPTKVGRASKFLAFDANGNPIASAAVSDGDALLRAELIAGASSLVKSTGIKYDITDAETAAGVTPVNYYIPSNDIIGIALAERYGNNITPGTTNMRTALANADLVATQAGCYVGSIKKLHISTSLTLINQFIYSLPTQFSTTSLVNFSVLPTDVQPSTWGAVREIRFDRYYPTQRPADVQVIGSPASAAINSNSQLEVDADYASTTNRIFMPSYKFGEGILRFRIVRAKFMIRLSQPDWAGRAIWSSDGSTIELGTITAANVVTSLGTATMAGIAGDVIWVEFITGPMSNGTSALVRTWKDGAARPSSPQINVAYGAGVVGAEKNEGILTLSSFSGTPAKYVSFQFMDGSNDSVQAIGQVSFIGRWFPRFDGFKLCMATIRGGDKFRFKVIGATTVNVRYAGTSGIISTAYPYCDTYVDGVFWSSTNFTQAAGSFNTVALLTGLDRGRSHNVEVRIRGVNEANDKYLLGAGLLIESLYADAGRISPWQDTRPKMLFIGDSITEGIIARGAPSLPINSAGDKSWPVLSAESLNCQAILNGFGGTGLTIAGSGGMPSADMNAFYYMKDRAIDTANENIHFIVINHGTNDAGASVSTSTFQAAYITFLQKLLSYYPSVQCIYAMRPFGGQYATQISTAVSTLVDPRIIYIDTSTWTTITYTDGTHPDVAGHAAAAAYFVTAVGNLQPSSLT